jgi:hypothetical protein
MMIPQYLSQSLVSWASLLQPLLMAFLQWTVLALVLPIEVSAVGHLPFMFINNVMNNTTPYLL